MQQKLTRNQNPRPYDRKAVSHQLDHRSSFKITWKVIYVLAVNCFISGFRTTKQTEYTYHGLTNIVLETVMRDNVLDNDAAHRIIVQRWWLLPQAEQKCILVYIPCEQKWSFFQSRTNHASITSSPHARPYRVPPLRTFSFQTCTSANKSAIRWWIKVQPK